MSMQQRVIHETNLAVDMIEDGAYDEASSKLCTVFQAYQHNCDIIDDDGCLYKSSISLDQCMTKGHPMSSSFDPDFPFMYSDGIRIPAKVATAGIPRHDVASIILFNLALAYHLSALDSKDPGSDLRKALRAYELIYTMQQENKGNFLSNLMFVLSVLNNIGIIYQWRNDDALAAKCFDKLLSLFMFLSDHRQSRREDKNEEEVLRGFYRNAVLNQASCASAA